MVDLSKFIFYSQVNYMKRSEEFTGNANKSISGTGEAVATETVTHNLGYVPQFDVYMDVEGDGTLWYDGSIVWEGTEAIGGASTPYVEMRSHSNTTQLVMYIDDFTSGGTSGTRDIYWLIYLDYGV